MTQVDIVYLEDKDGNKVAPITHVNAVRDDNGDTLPDILDRDYPTTSKTPVENSSEVSLCTRGEKYEWNKVGNATDATGASDITSTFKYLLLNGTTGAFETALKSYVEESVRAALGSLLNNLDKGTGVKAVAGIDNNNDLGSVTLSNLASVLGVPSLLCRVYSIPANSTIYPEQRTNATFLCSYWYARCAMVSCSQERGVQILSASHGFSDAITISIETAGYKRIMITNPNTFDLIVKLTFFDGE